MSHSGDGINAYARYLNRMCSSHTRFVISVNRHVVTLTRDEVLNLIPKILTGRMKPFLVLTAM